MKRLMAQLRRVGNTLLDVIYPEDAVCLICGELPPEGSCLCQACRHALTQTRLTEDAAQVPGAERTVSCWHHGGIPRRLVHYLKYEGLVCAASALAEGMAEAAQDMALPSDTVVTWVTMGAHKRRERGVDHGRLLAEAVAARLSLPCRAVLCRTEEKGEHTQQGLNRADRLTNLAGRFSCGALAGGHYLLVDDVLTTGATAAVCTKAMLIAGAESVAVLTATRAGR